MQCSQKLDLKQQNRYLITLRIRLKRCYTILSMFRDWRYLFHCPHNQSIHAYHVPFPFPQSSRLLSNQNPKTPKCDLINSKSLYLVCYYDGIPHEHGSKWSPGPCSPECACQNGNVRCTVIQCPKLTCSKQVKKRWRCCPECTNEGKFD